MTGDYSEQQERALKPVIIDGVEPIACIFCGFSSCCELDLRIHLKEDHWMELVELPIVKGKMPLRVEYAINKGRRGPKPAIQVSTSNPNFDSIDSELRAAKNRWIQTNRPLEVIG
jgi:hypothetical protein